jgi:hypothetical protein
MRKYNSLFQTHIDQPEKEVFSHFKFKNENWESPFEKIANKARHEEWNFQKDEFRNPKVSYPILSNYLNQTFLRLQEQGKIKYSDEGSACFNTGLQTNEGKDIFILFYENLSPHETAWTLFGIYDSYSNKLEPFYPLPEIADYIEDTNDLVFNLNYELEINFAHIVDDNKERLPETFQENRTVAKNAIEGATKFLKDKIRRNYKVAIPSWYKGHIQLLLPLNLTDENEADLALVADKDDSRNIYRIRTALTMDMAYKRARLLCRPDRDWLNP